MELRAGTRLPAHKGARAEGSLAAGLYNIAGVDGGGPRRVGTRLPSGAAGWLTIVPPAQRMPCANACPTQTRALRCARHRGKPGCIQTGVPECAALRSVSAERPPAVHASGPWRVAHSANCLAKCTLRPASHGRSLRAEHQHWGPPTAPHPAWSVPIPCVPGTGAMAFRHWPSLSACCR